MRRASLRALSGEEIDALPQERAWRHCPCLILDQPESEKEDPSNGDGHYLVGGG